MIETLIKTKNDIKSAILEVDPSVNIQGGMTTYADIIRNEYNIIIGYDMSWIYDEEEAARCINLVWN